MRLQTSQIDVERGQSPSNVEFRRWSIGRQPSSCLFFCPCVFQSIRLTSFPATCKLYKSPIWNQRVNSSTPVSFKWDPACLDEDTAYVTLKLLSSRGEVFRWEYVDGKAGNYDTELNADWWDQGLEVPLQVAIMAQDEPIFLSPYPAGPIFTAVNSNPPASSLSVAATTASGAHTQTSVTHLSNFAGGGGTLNVASYVSSQRAGHRGRVAAAVVVPLLLAIALAVGGYVFWSRRNTFRRRQQWADNIDKRMSRISSDWQSISAAEARGSVHGSAAARPSLHSARERTKSEYSRRSTSMLGGGVAGVGATNDGRSPIFDKFNSSSRSSGLTREKGPSSPDEYGDEKVAFAEEDLTQLGPRARALSAAAAEGRPLSSLVKENMPTDSVGVTRKRSKSVAADRIVPRTHIRTQSTASNNPYANAMSQRDSQAISIDGTSLRTFPTSPDPRQRADSYGAMRSPIPRNRNDSATSRARVASRVSFADVPIPRPSGDRGAVPPHMRTSRTMSTTGDFTVDFDALPALALMRVKSEEGLNGVAFPSGDGSSLTPTREFIPPMKREGQSASQQGNGAGLSGRTPDEMLKAYAAAMAGERGEYGQEMEMGLRKDATADQGGVFASMKKFTERWRK
ncbi:hypothetical protein FS842_004977 [Serendipita sp. 407]|nr:hypothetical protein FS842_004977 [Serendipita sp. 407]